MQWSSPLVDPEFLWSPSGLVLPSVKVPRCSRRENFTLSILVALISIMLMFLVLFSSLLCRPAGPANCDRSPSGQLARLSHCFQHGVELASPSWALSLQFIAFIAPEVGSYLGAMSVWASLVTLYGRINKTLGTKVKQLLGVLNWLRYLWGCEMQLHRSAGWYWVVYSMCC